MTALEHVLTRLSKMIVMDGEGATKFVEVRVVDAASEEVAAQAARAIANSNLVKTAINGEDANWGRILAAVGIFGHRLQSRRHGDQLRLAADPAAELR